MYEVSKTTTVEMYEHIMNPIHIVVNELFGVIEKKIRKNNVSSRESQYFMKEIKKRMINRYLIITQNGKYMRI